MASSILPGHITPAHSPLAVVPIDRSTAYGRLWHQVENGHPSRLWLLGVLQKTVACLAHVLASAATLTLYTWIDLYLTEKKRVVTPLARLHQWGANNMGKAHIEREAQKEYHERIKAAPAERALKNEIPEFNSRFFGGALSTEEIQDIKPLIALYLPWKKKLEELEGALRRTPDSAPAAQAELKEHILKIKARLAFLLTLMDHEDIRNKFQGTQETVCHFEGKTLQIQYGSKKGFQVTDHTNPVQAISNYITRSLQ